MEAGEARVEQVVVANQEAKVDRVASELTIQEMEAVEETVVQVEIPVAVVEAGEAFRLGFFPTTQKEI